MGREKNPSLPSSCIICRQRILNKLGINGGGGDDDVLRLKALSLESFFMLFGLPTGADHPLASMFLNGDHSRKAQFCNECFQTSTDAQFLFWQLGNLEGKLLECQDRMFRRLRSNYDAVPVATLFSTVGVEDIKSNLEGLSYDELVKILFDNIRDKKEEWPKSTYISKWRDARKNAERVWKSLLSESTPVVLSNPDEVDIKPKVEITSDVSVKPDGVDNGNSVVTPSSVGVARGRGRRKITRKYPGMKTEIEDDRNDPSSSSHDDADDMWILPTDEDKVNVCRRPGRRALPKKKMKSRITIRRKLKALTVSEDGKQTYECMEEPSACNETFDTIRRLKSHVKLSHPEKQYPCDHQECKRTYKSEDLLEKHIARAHAKKEQKPRLREVCDICGVKVKRGDLKKHYYLRHVGVGKFICSTCSMDFDDPDEFARHEILHQQSGYPFMCIECHQLFTNSRDLKTHVSSNHMSSGLKCDTCGIMKANEFLLQRHMKSHEKRKCFICECGKVFASKGYLNYHKEHAHAIVQKAFPCEVCGKTFQHMKNAIRHQVTHSEEKPFKCKICSKTFNYSHLLKKHEEIHSGTKNYGCEICGKRFRQEQNLTQHMRSHRPKPEKPPSKKKPRKSRVSPSPIAENPMGEEEIVPVIFDIKGDAGIAKEDIEAKIENEMASTTTITLPAESSVGHFETIQEIREIQISHGDNMEPQTATVLFVTTTDPNFQWLT